MHTDNFKNAVDINGLRIYLAFLFLPLKMGLECKCGSQINHQNQKMTLNEDKKKTHTHRKQEHIMEIR